MPRPFTELSAAQKAEVETLAAVLTVAQMADYFGIGRTTFFTLMDRDPEVAERYKRGKAKAIGAIAQSLIAKARGGDTASMIFFLKTQGGWRETDRVEHSGPDGGPVELSDGRARLMALIQTVAQRQGHADGATPVALAGSGGGEERWLRSRRQQIAESGAATSFACWPSRLIRLAMVVLGFSLLALAPLVCVPGVCLGIALLDRAAGPW